MAVVLGDGFSPAVALERIKEGGDTGYRPGDGDVHNSVALDGGGIKTAHNVGVAIFLQESGYLQGFDSVVGSSAGSIVAATLLSGQIRDAEEVFTEILIDEGFVDFSRIVRGRPILDLNVLRDIITLSKPLDVQRLLASPLGFGFGLTDLSNLNPVLATKEHLKAQEEVHAGTVIDLLMMGMHLPILAGPPATRYADGGLSWTTTGDVSTAMGADLILEFCNNVHLTWSTKTFATALVGRWIRRHGRNGKGSKLYRDFTTEQVLAINERPGTDSPATIAFPELFDLSLLESIFPDKSKLVHAVEVGKNTGRAAFGCDTEDIPAYPEMHKLKIALEGLAAATRKVIQGRTGRVGLQK